jgi:hypothetical protein
LEENSAVFARGMGAMDSCEREFEELVNRAIDYLAQYKAWWLSEFHTKKEQIIAAFEREINEANYCLENGQSPVSELACKLLNTSYGASSLFRYALNNSKLEEFCATLVIFESDFEVCTAKTGQISSYHCLLGCNRLISLSERAEVSCNCIYCEDCFTQKTKETGCTVHCSACGKALSVELQKKYREKELLDQLTSRVKTCEICDKWVISGDLRVTLKSGHVVHRNCVPMQTGPICKFCRDF